MQGLFHWIQLAPLTLGMLAGAAPAGVPGEVIAVSTPEPVPLPAGASPVEPAAVPATAPSAVSVAAPAGPHSGEPQAPPQEPLYSVDAYHQDAESLIMAFAEKANISVTMLDRYSSRVSVRFKNLPFEKAWRRLMLASDLGFHKDEDGYFVGLPSDLQLDFPDPNARIIDATYRCRRTDADTLVKAIREIMGDSDIRAAKGPAFLTPEVEGSGGGGGGGGYGGNHDSSIRALKTGDLSIRTHDVVFSGSPEKVRRALGLARKFDRPRKEVRVNVKIVRVNTSYTRTLGVDWTDTLPFTAVEGPSPNVAASGSAAVTEGLKLGKFNHTPLTLNATLNALEESGNGKVLSNPTLLVLDGEKAFILSGTKYVFPKITTNSSSGQPIYDTQTEKLGVYLQVSVQVGLDDDMVMSIYPQVSSLKQLQTINGNPYPIITTEEEQATVRAVKGDVIVLGGLTSNSENFDEFSVPFLSKIPLIGKLFTSHIKKHETSELMFFLTPEILDEDIPPLRATITSTHPAPAPAH
jgi:type IV pilus assembly protein PilQ